MSLRYQLTPSAQQDVERIADFIAEDNVDAALRVHDALEEAFRHLAERPGMGHSRADLTARPLKLWSVYSYLVVYDPASTPLTFVAVLHGARRREHLEVVTASRGACVTSGVWIPEAAYFAVLSSTIRRDSR